jgi:hypothetical protein
VILSALSRDTHEVNMPGHIEDDAIVGAQLAVAAQEVAKHDAELRKSVEARKSDAAAADDAPAEKELTGIPEPGALADSPSEEDLHTLRRVADHIPLKLFTIAFIELCERFSYYGTVIVVCIHHQMPRPSNIG